VVESNTILGNYFLLSISPSGRGSGGGGILEPLTPAINRALKREYVGFWRVPSGAPVYGLKPNSLGNNMHMSHHPTLRA